MTMTPWEVIKTDLPKVDFNAYHEIMRSVREILAKYAKVLIPNSFLFCTPVLKSIKRITGQNVDCEVVFVMDNLQQTEYAPVDIHIPIIYLTDEEALKLAAIKQKEAERMPRAEVDKIRETDEYKEYCRLNEKYKWLDQIKFS